MLRCGHYDENTYFHIFCKDKKQQKYFTTKNTDYLILNINHPFAAMQILDHHYNGAAQTK